jgi:TctA family transporter
MELLDNLQMGFYTAVSLQNLGFALIGCLLGTLIGILPGIGPIPAIAMLLPVTYGLEPLSSLIMLAGIYYGAAYGGSTTAILVNMPGEAASIVTCLDGNQMTRQGRGGAALAIAALGSFFAGTVATILIGMFAPALASIAQKFNSPEYFSLMVLGLITAVVMAQGSVIKAIGVVLVGLLFGLVGADVITGASRYTFGLASLWEGIDFLPVVIGLFGIAEVIRSLEAREDQKPPVVVPFQSLWPSAQELRASWRPVLRGTGIGSFLGILPGGGAALSSFVSYAVEKKVAADPSRFGKGAIEGVAGPESANNAGSQTSFIPLLTLGFPSNAVMALMMGAMMIHGIQPGSAVMTSRPDLFWGLIASMWIGNLMLVILNLPLLPIWMKIVYIPYRILYPCILVFCLVGVFVSNPEPASIYLVAAFAAFAYVLSRTGCEPAPFVLGFLLGPLMEENLRRTMVLSHGDPMVFIQRPISATLLVLAVAVLALVVVPIFATKRQQAFAE